MVGYNTNLAGLLAPNANYTWNIKIQQIDCSGNYYLQGTESLYCVSNN